MTPCLCNVGPPADLSGNLVSVATCPPLIQCMKICIFGDMQELMPTGIGEEQIHDSAPLVRGLLVARLEALWRSCEPYLNGEVGKPDPRFVEAGIRVLDRLSRIYRLEAPARSLAEPEEPGQLRGEVEAKLTALEARMKD